MKVAMGSRLLSKALAPYAGPVDQTRERLCHFSVKGKRRALRHSKNEGFTSISKAPRDGDLNTLTPHDKSQARRVWCLVADA